MPQTLAEAVDALESDTFFRGCFGDRLVDNLVTMKRSEVSRHAAWVEENDRLGAA